jgi:CDP-diacylglycerol--serine O-phosphatidyltransferase
MTDVVEPSDGAQRSKLALARLLVPNAVTSASLLVAIVAALRALDSAYVEAGWLLVLCALLDKLDGALARALSATSRFGLELDSLVDFVAFGVVPGLLVHRVCTDPELAASIPWTSSGWRRTALDASIAAYVLCTALRLARFNVLEERVPLDSPNVFWGLPTTYAGGLLALWIVIALQRGLPEAAAPLPVLLFLLGVLMLSNLALPKVTLRHRPWIDGVQIAVAIVASACGLLRIFPELLLALTLAYGVLGFGWGLRYRARLVVPAPGDAPSLTQRPPAP